jgi:hypothetical protein
MKMEIEMNSSNHPGRVRRNTRPYVGAMDWCDIINTDPFKELVQYYGSIDIGGYFRLGVLWRYRNEEGLHYQEAWSARSKSWESTLYLTRMIIGGECSLADMTIEQAMRVEPDAFTNQATINNVP